METVSPWLEKLSTIKKKAIHELVLGRECATQLQILFHESSEEVGGAFSAKELVLKILRSFNETLSVLSSCDSAEISQNQTACNDNSPCCDDWRSEDSSESRKKPASSKDKRGCYKRKRAAETWNIVSTTLEDGYAWRKYGQKEILNSKFPRSYFRCTRKYDQGCRAIKQVQRMEEDSQMFETTYIGTHTCRDSFRSPPIIKESWESHMATSGNSNIPTKQQHHQLNPSTTQTVKQETKEETTLSDLTDLDSVIWKDIMGGSFEYSSEPGMGSDYGDVVCNVYSCTEITSRNFELEFVKDFHFDESKFVQ